MHLTFAALFPHLQHIDWTKPVALGVSGGGDSMALLAAVSSYKRAKKLNTAITVLTVDHALRKNTQEEIEYVAKFCATHSITHQTLSWHGEKPRTHLMQAAREARLSYLSRACEAKKITQLLLAHTLDDQAETLLMRAKRGGFRGHAAISPLSYMQGLTIIRPFLSVHRQTLRFMLQEAQIMWHEDPTNSDMRYERSRTRKQLIALETINFEAQLLAKYAHIMRRLRHIMASDISRLIETTCHLDVRQGTMTIHASPFAYAPSLIALNALRELIRFISGRPYMVSFKTANQALMRLRKKAGHNKAISVGLCVLKPRSNDIWQLSRAARHLPTIKICAPTEYLWDGRFLLRFSPENCQDIQIVPHPQRPIIPSIIGQNRHSKLALSKVSIQFYPKVMQGPICAADLPIYRTFNNLIQEVQKTH